MALSLDFFLAVRGGICTLARSATSRLLPAIHLDPDFCQAFPPAAKVKLKAICVLNVACSGVRIPGVRLAHYLCLDAAPPGDKGVFLASCKAKLGAAFYLHVSKCETEGRKRD